MSFVTVPCRQPGHRKEAKKTGGFSAPRSITFSELFLGYDQGAYYGYYNRKIGRYRVYLVLFELFHVCPPYGKVVKLFSPSAVFLVPIIYGALLREY